jgi:excisionase family DNA binding protein
LFGFRQANISSAQLRQGALTLDRLLSVDEAAAKLGGLSKYTIHAWLSKGKLRRTKVGSRTMIRECDLATFIDSCNPPTVSAESSDMRTAVR